MSLIPGETPFFRAVDKYINLGVRSETRVEQKRARITVEVDAFMKSLGAITPGFIFGCRASDGVFVTCKKGAADGSGIPAAIAYKDSSAIDLLNTPVGTQFNWAAIVSGWVSPSLVVDQIDPSWGATAAAQWAELVPLLRFARFLPLDDASLSNKASALVEVTMTSQFMNVLIARGASAIQHGPASKFHVPADVAARLIAEGVAV